MDFIRGTQFGRKPKGKVAKQEKKVETRIRDAELIILRRKQIIEGAIKIFIRKGFHGATVREIADAAGVTMGTLYNYIHSKEDIIYIVYDYVTGVLREEMNSAISGVEEPKTRLKVALRHNLKTIYENDDLIMFLYKESAFLDKESLHAVLARETEYIALFEELLRDYFRKLGKRVDETRLRVAADLLSYIPVILALRRWSLRKRYKSMDTILPEILGFMLSGIGFVPTGREKKLGKKGR